MPRGDRSVQAGAETCWVTGRSVRDRAEGVIDMDVIGRPRRFRWVPYVLGGLLGVSMGLVLVSGVLFFKSTRGTESVAASSYGGDGSESTTGAEPAPGAVTIEDSRRNAIVMATERAAPAVVSIASKHTELVRRHPFGPTFPRDWLEQFFGMPDTYMREYSNLGSGVIIHEDGYVLTNYHVVQGADKIQVTFSDGTTYEGGIVGSAPDYDLALVKVQGGKFLAAELGDSDELLVGEWAIAIGSPFGQLLNDTQPTVTVGVISALHRDVKDGGQDGRIYKDMIQTDAAINPGNSGGPLVDSRGRVVGINTSIFTARGGGNIGIGFAIPINRGKWVLEEIQTYGRVREVWVGVTVMDVTPQAAATLSLPQAEGLLIREIQLGSPADKSGLKPGDLIVAVNGARVRTTHDANRRIFGSRIGEKIIFDIIREGDEKTITITLEERPNET
jgi:serine protease Do